MRDRFRSNGFACVDILGHDGAQNVQTTVVHSSSLIWHSHYLSASLPRDYLFRPLINTSTELFQTQLRHKINEFFHPTQKCRFKILVVTNG